MRSYRRYNSQHHAERVDVTPFTGLESVHDRDSADNAASRAGLSPGFAPIVLEAAGLPEPATVDGIA